ncbi:MAG: 4Fe-4S binding protein [Nitrospiraceae bacterium]|nr:4Fe-4S binding protein [Nitrospiraceae bacterium]
MTKTRKIQPYRHFVLAAQAAFFLGLPFLRIGGKSALRFDLPTLRLYFFGRTIWMQEFFLVLAALLFFTFLLILVTILFGRIWCGWFCPQSVLTDLTRFADRPGRRAAATKAGVLLLTLLVSAVVAADLIWYFISPYEFFDRLGNNTLGSVTGWCWSVTTIVLFADLAFVRQRFCATICPYSKMQSAIFDDRTMVLAFDPRRQKECMNCGACLRVCPVGIDIRQGPSSACVNCAECRDTCGGIMAKRGMPGLIGYFFGVPDKGFSPMRRNVLLISAVTLSMLVFLVVVSAGRKPLDMTVMPANNFSPRFVEGGRAVNAYLIAFENRGDRALEVSLSASGAPVEITLTPKKISLLPGQHKTSTVFAEAADPYHEIMSVTFRITASYGAGSSLLVRKAVFMTPQAR